MSNEVADRLARVLVRWARLVRRFRVLVVVAAAAAAVSSVWLAASELGIDTDAEALFSDDLPWRVAMDEYQDEFPHVGHTLLVVLDGPTQGATKQMEERLIRALKRGDSVSGSIYAPRGEPYFQRVGLLFRSRDELRSLASRVETYGGILRRLERDPTLPALATVLDSTLDAEERRDNLDLAPIFGLLGRAFGAGAGRRPFVAPWSDVFRAERSSAADRRRFVVIRPRLDYTRARPGREAIRTVRKAVEELDLEDRAGADVRLTGRVAMQDEEIRSAKQGAQRAGVLALLLVTVILYLGLRSWRLIFAALATLAVGLAGTAAFAAVAVGHLNLISVAFAVLYIGLGIDYAIHLVLRYRELRSGGRAHGEALQGAVRDVGPSLVLSAVTTGVAFYAFAATDFVGLSELGTISGTGMFVSLAATLTLFPALLDLAPLAEVGEDPEPLAGAMSAAADGLERHGGALLWGSLLVGAVAAALAPGAWFDPNPLRLRDPDTESVSTYVQLLKSETVSPLTISLLRPSAREAREAADSAATLEAVRSARTLEDFVPDDQTGKLPILARIRSALGPTPTSGEPEPTGAEEGLRAVRSIRADLAEYAPFATAEERPRVRDAIRQIRRWERTVSLWDDGDQAPFVHALEEGLLEPLPRAVAGLREGLVADTVTRADLPGNVVRRWVSPGGTHRVEVRPRGSMAESRALEQFVDDVLEHFPDATGAPVVRRQAGVAALRAFRTALVLAVAGTVVILLAALRSAPQAVKVLLPLLLAGLVTVGVSVAFGMPFNFANLITLPLLLGVGVDNGIHMVHRYRTGAPGSSLLRTSTARAVLVSFLTTIFSFGNLAFSPHRGMASMGRLLAIGMATVLAATLVLLPLLLRTGSAERDPAVRPAEERTP